MSLNPNGRRTGFPAGRRRRRGWAAPAALVLAALAACDLDSVLTVDDPFVVTPGTARDTANLRNLYAGVRSNLLTAVGGIQNDEGGFVLQTALFTDEMVSTDQFDTRRQIDMRQVLNTNAAIDTPYTYLQRARASAVNAADLFAASERAGSVEHAELYSIAGFAEVMLAEGFCAGVPLSRVDNDGTFFFGAPLTREALLDSAVATFALAAGQPGAGAGGVALARLGTARALLFRGDFAAAAAAAAQVPDDFVYNVEFSGATLTTYNAVEQLANEEIRWGAADREGTNGLPFLSADDPRTPWELTAVEPLAGGVHFAQLKYPTRDSPIPLATGYEARLIQAEAALRGGDAAAALELVNRARDIRGLEPLGTLGATEAERVDTLFRERAFSLWLTGHRLGDLRRLVRQYGRPQETVFPVGRTRNDEIYGTDVNLPIPFKESNNPNFRGCLDRDA